MQKYLISFLLGGLLVAGVALADHGEETGVDAIDPAEAVSSADLGVEDAGILPTSRLYFFKELGRGIQSLFTFGSVKKAELELRFANEKAAEAKKVQETQPNNEQAIAKALGNYQKSQERLKVRLESLKETSQNPNVDRLLDQVTEKAVKHAKLVEEIALKAKDVASLQELALTVREKIEESTALGAVKDDPSKFVARLEKSLVDSRGGELKHLRSLTLIDRISEKAPEEMKESLERLREEFSERFQGDLKAILEKKTSEDLSHALEKVPGDSARHSVILGEIQAKETGKIAASLKKSADKLGEDVKDKKNIARKAAEQIQHADERIQKLERKLAEIPEPPAVVKNILEKAKEHLTSAQSALQEGKYGEAFGQARSAEVLARNGLKMFEELQEAVEEEEEDVEDLKEEFEEEIQELDFKISRYEELVKSKGFTQDQHPEVLKLLELARQHLGFARDSLTKEDFAGTKLHISHVKGFLREIAKAVESQQRRSEKLEEFKLLPVPIVPQEKQIKEEREAVLCTAEYDPVCGVDGKTYSNRCVAEKQNAARVAYEGECKPTTERYFKYAMLDNENEFIVVKMTDPATVKKALEDLRGRRILIVGGILKAGNDGYNSRWSWHMIPESIKLGEIFMEVCDARPSWVESHLGEWIGKTYCPYGAKITEEVYPSFEPETNIDQ